MAGAIMLYFEFLEGNVTPLSGRILIAELVALVALFL